VRSGVRAVRIPIGTPAAQGNGSTRKNCGQKDLEGEQSPGRIGRRIVGNGESTLRTHRRSNASKSTTTVSIANKLDSGNGSEGKTRRARWKNDKEATAVVTRYG
jgi:hypothetical protein